MAFNFRRSLYEMEIREVEARVRSLAAFPLNEFAEPMSDDQRERYLTAARRLHELVSEQLGDKRHEPA